MPRLENLLTPNQVRMLEGLRTDASPTVPTFRFHGHNEPKRVVNELPTGPITDGKATLRLYDPIDSWGGDWGVSAKEFAAALDALPADVNTIELHINSPGGEVFDGIAILNALRNHPARVVAVVDGIAASAASFIACGADELVMGRNAEMMIHDARGICMGNAADMQAMMSLLGHLSDNIAGLYAAKSGASVAQWRAAMRDEMWLSAQEAVDAGLADRVEGDEQPTNTFDLSMFTYAGRKHAPKPPVAEIMQPHVFIDSDGDGTCDVCGMPKGENDAHMEEPTQRLSQRIAAQIDAPDQNVITQALGWFTAIDSVVDDAQETLAAYLNVPNPDTDDGDMQMSNAHLRHRLNARRYGFDVA